ncbi:hypothetical protein ABPG72_005625 [Tetrahymena utriculariae]
MSKQKMKQLYVKCKKCSRQISAVFEECPRCLDDSNIFHQVVKKAAKDPVYRDRKQVSYQSIQDSNQNEIQTQKQNIEKNEAQCQFPVMNLNNYYKFNESFFKYFIMIITLTLTICILVHDMSGLRQKELSQIVNDIDLCMMNYVNHGCENIIQDPKIIEKWKQMCIQWKICKDKDPYSEVQLLKIMSTYFAGIMSLSLDQMNGKAVGIILLIYFFGIILKQFLSCLCPRRSKD